MIRTVKINAEDIVVGDMYVDLQRGGPDCHCLYVSHRERIPGYTTDPKAMGWVIIKSASGETRRFESNKEIHVMVRSK